MEKKFLPIGMLDSGVGGLTVVREIINSLPRENIVYYGDTLHLPYGPRLLEEVQEFVIQIIDYLINEKKAKAIVLACNTATSAVRELITQKYSLPVFGTISSVTKTAYRLSECKKIGIIGTEGTINSQAYQKALLKLDSQLKVFAVACPGFVEMVEKGQFRGRKVEQLAYRYLNGLRKTGIDVLILGCTHFPYLISVIQKVMGAEVILLSSGRAMVREIKRKLQQEDLLNPETAKKTIKIREFLVSDREKISRSFLQKGSDFLDLPSLECKEENIFE